MRTIYDKFTHQMGDRLDTVVMGLGLVRLLQDARRFEEAQATLYSLEDFQGAAEKSVKRKRKHRKTIRTASCSSGVASTRIAATEMRPHPLCLA